RAAGRRSGTGALRRPPPAAARRPPLGGGQRAFGARYMSGPSGQDGPPTPEPVSPRRRGPWVVTGTREVYQNPWIRVREDQVIRPNGAPGIYGVVESTPAVGVVAVTTDERVYLVGQYRYTVEEYSWEIITGYSAAGEDLLAGAARELREEA